MVDNRIDKIEIGATESLASLVLELQSLKTDVDDYNRVSEKRFTINLAAIVGVIALVIATIVVVYQVSTLTHQIGDCIQTNGKCYQSAQRKTGGAAKYITDIGQQQTIAANWCALQKPATLEAYKTCVTQTLAKLQ